MTDLPQSLVEGTKIAWADQTFTIDGIQQGNMAQFEASPFKTPSRKPNVLRQIVKDSRNLKNSDQTQRNTMLNSQRIEASTPLVSTTPLHPATQLRDRTTQRNTMLNSITPLQSKTPLKLKFNNMSGSPDCVNATSAHVIRSFSGICASTTPVTSMSLNRSLNVVQTPGLALDSTFSVVKSPGPDPSLHSRSLLSTSSLNSNVVPPTITKSRHPRTPSIDLENTTDITSALCNTYKKSSRRRSMSEGRATLFKRTDSLQKPSASRMLSPKKVLYPSKVMKNKNRPKFAPMRGPGRGPARTSSVSEKENTEPIDGRFRVKGRSGLKSNLPTFKRGEQLQQQQHTLRL